MNDFDELKDQWREEMSERKANDKEMLTFDEWAMVFEEKAMLWDNLNSELDSWSELDNEL